MTYDINSIVPSYINQASSQEITIFFQVLVGLSRADGKSDTEEMDFITQALKDLDINNIDEILAPHSDDEIIESAHLIKNRHLALELIRKMCLLSHIDSELSDNETLFIGKVGLAMGIELEKIEQISNWVIDHIVWIEQARLIFEEDQ